jgi:hypothetical protein
MDITGTSLLDADVADPFQLTNVQALEIACEDNAAGVRCQRRRGAGLGRTEIGFN